MNEIRLSVRETTLYALDLPDGRTYQTFDYDKAHRMQALTADGVLAAECVDCKAVIPVALVDSMAADNACPATTSRHHRGHRVPSDVYALLTR